MTSNKRNPILDTSTPCPLCAKMRQEGKECDACRGTGTLTIERMLDYMAANEAASEADLRGENQSDPEVAEYLQRTEFAIYGINLLRACLEGKAEFPPELRLDQFGQ